jgi:hypothetical protein
MSTGTGPQHYPGANRDHWYQDDFEGARMEVNAVVLHTTEGRSLPGYGGGASAPNLTAVPDLAAKKLKWYQHFDIDISSRALLNRPGGVETNTLNVCQAELVGTCDPELHTKWQQSGKAHVYWPKAPDWALLGVPASSPGCTPSTASPCAARPCGPRTRSPPGTAADSG